VATIQMTSSEDAAAQRRTTRGGRPGLSGVLPQWSIDQVLTVVASLLVPLGVVAIGLGWYGAAHTPFLFEQLPYLISGGMLGVGLLAAGGLLYFGSWIAKLAQQQREDSAALRELLTAMRTDLQASAIAGAGAVDAGRFVATANGSMYHLPDCSVVAGKDGLRSVSQFEAAAMKPCKLCKPDLAD
jgi:hypothetical protein